MALPFQCRLSEREKNTLLTEQAALIGRLAARAAVETMSRGGFLAVTEILIAAKRFDLAAMANVIIDTRAMLP